MLIVALPGVLLWYLDTHNSINIGDVFLQSYKEFAWELISISFTILIIDRLYQQQDVRREKAQLLRQLRSKDIQLVKEASERIRAQGWLADGTLRGANLRNAALHEVNWPEAKMQNCNLESAILYKANLSGTDFENSKIGSTDLSFANLRGANVSDLQLQTASKLAHAIMPDGSRYNGRFHLSGDSQDAQVAGFNVNDKTALCRFYDIPFRNFPYQ